MAIFKLRTAWWTLAALLTLASAAFRDQVVMWEGENRATFKAVTHHGRHIELPRKGEKVSLKTDGGFHAQGAGVEVKFLGFDDYWPTEDFPNSTYESDWDSYLHFDNFHIIYASEANDKGFIDTRDLDCAASKPLNLFNSPLNYSTPSVIRSNATTLAAAGLSEYFDVIAWSWKPMGPYPKDADEPLLELSLYRIEPDGKDYSFVDGAISGFYLEDGFFEPDTWVPGDYFYNWGEGVNWMEFGTMVLKNGDLASGRYDFCLDNLVLLFYKKE